MRLLSLATVSALQRAVAGIIQLGVRDTGDEDISQNIQMSRRRRAGTTIFERIRTSRVERIRCE